MLPFEMNINLSVILPRRRKEGSRSQVTIVSRYDNFNGKFHKTQEADEG